MGRAVTLEGVAACEPDFKAQEGLLMRRLQISMGDKSSDCTDLGGQQGHTIQGRESVDAGAISIQARAVWLAMARSSFRMCGCFGHPDEDSATSV